MRSDGPAMASIAAARNSLVTGIAARKRPMDSAGLRRFSHADLVAKTIVFRWTIQFIFNPHESRRRESGSIVIASHTASGMRADRTRLLAVERRAAAYRRAAHIFSDWRWSTMQPVARDRETLSLSRPAAGLDGCPASVPCFTPPLQRQGVAAHRADAGDGLRALLAGCSAWIGSYYERFGFRSIPIDEVTVNVTRRKFAPAMLRAGDDRACRR
jgi:hypothetical protein